MNYLKENKYCQLALDNRLSMNLNASNLFKYKSRYLIFIFLVTVDNVKVIFR